MGQNAIGLFPSKSELDKIPITYLSKTTQKETSYPILSACRLRNPGYVCTYSSNLKDDKDHLAAYRPSEICDYTNYPLYSQSNELKQDFQSESIWFYSILIAFGCWCLLSLLFYYIIHDHLSSLGYGFLSSLVIFVLTYYLFRLNEKKQLAFQIKNKTYSKTKCYNELYTYASILATSKSDDKHKVNPNSFIVKSYETPNAIDVGVMMYYDKWKYSVPKDESIELMKRFYNLNRYNLFSEK